MRISGDSAIQTHQLALGSANTGPVSSTVESVKSNSTVRSPHSFSYFVPQQHQQQHQQQQHQQHQHQQQHQQPQHQQHQQQQQQLSVKLEEPPPAHAHQLSHSQPYYAEEYRRPEPAERLERPTVVSLS